GTLPKSGIVSFPSYSLPETSPETETEIDMPWTSTLNWNSRVFPETLIFDRSADFDPLPSGSSKVMVPLYLPSSFFIVISPDDDPCGVAFSSSQAPVRSIFCDLALSFDSPLVS